ncbi:MAG: DUF501 domain-containing protein [Acidimicrobiales bacterium]|nr:DUF501 domain-containing protein [Acidimicrobiales bacterium]
MAGALLAAGEGSRFQGAEHKLLADLDGQPVVAHALRAMVGAGFNELFIVTGAVDLAPLVRQISTETGVPINTIENPRWAEGQATSLHAALRALQPTAHSAVVVGLGDQPFVGVAPWRTVGASQGTIVTATFDGQRRPPVKLDRSVWSLVSPEGDAGARVLMQQHPDLVSEVPCNGDPLDIDTAEDLLAARSLSERAEHLSDAERVTRLLGRPPMGNFTVCVRRNDRSPVVVANAPLFHNGRPMPTRFWLCDPVLVRAISKLESNGGVKAAEAELDPELVRLTHQRASAERDALIPSDHEGPRPFGGVGGTRRGVKCLHTHYANYLAGAPDAVGEWVQNALARVGSSFDPVEPGVAP